MESPLGPNSAWKGPVSLKCRIYPDMKGYLKTIDNHSCQQQWFWARENVDLTYFPPEREGPAPSKVYGGISMGVVYILKILLQVSISINKGRNCYLLCSKYEQDAEF